MTTQQQLMDAIEPLIDRTGVADVLLAVAQICYEKGEHLRSNWQDSITAKDWERVGRYIDRLASKVDGESTR